MKTIRSILLVMAALWCTPANAADPEWAASGEWVDTCNCENPCPCWKGEKPTLKDCSDLYYFHINKGHWGAVSLDGADLIGVALSPPDKTMDQAAKDKDMVFANLYVSDKLSPDAAAAMEQLFGEHLAPVTADSSKKHAFKKVELHAAMTAAGARVTIPKVLDLDVRRTKTAFGNDTTAAPFSSASKSGVQKKYNFSDDGISWKLKGRNASFATFDWSSAKEAALAAAAPPPAAPVAPAPAAPSPAK